MTDSKAERKNWKTVTAVLCGYGERGRTYAQFALEFKDRLSIAAVVEPVEARQNACYLAHRGTRTCVFPTAFVIRQCTFM